jgi:hypothetical protein
MTYAEKLRDPRWQRKRLEVMQEHDFSCQDCGRNDLELHVHHIRYIHGKDPWDYSFDNYRCLCVNCHDRKHNNHNTTCNTSGIPSLFSASPFRDCVDVMIHRMRLQALAPYYINTPVVLNLIKSAQDNLKILETLCCAQLRTEGEAREVNRRRVQCLEEDPTIENLPLDILSSSASPTIEEILMVSVMWVWKKAQNNGSEEARQLMHRLEDWKNANSHLEDKAECQPAS